jgi:hypothetical protein
MVDPGADHKINKKIAPGLQTGMFHSFTPAKKCTGKKFNKQFQFTESY